MEQASQSIPTDVEYIPGSMERSFEGEAGPRLRATEKNELYQGTIVDAAKSVSNFNHNLQIALTIETVGGVRLSKWITVPVSNPEVAGHRPYADEDARARLQQDCREFVATILGQDSLPVVPRKIKDTKTYVDANGTELSKGEVSTAFREANDAINTQIVAWFKSPSELVGSSLFFGTYMSKPNDKGNSYARVAYTRAEAGDREVLTA